MRLFGYPYNNDLVICKDSPDYLSEHNLFKDMVSITVDLDWRQCGNSLALCYLAMAMPWKCQFPC